MNLFILISSYIQAYPGLSVFLSTFLLGDEMVYFFGFLSGQGIIYLWTVIFFSLLGNGGCDIFWFIIAKIVHSKKLKKKLFNKHEKDEILIQEISKGRIFITLLLSKFFYGTRLITIFYIAKKEKNFKKIIIYNTLAVFVWICFVAFIMYLIGSLTSISFNTVNNAHKVIGSGVVIILIVYLINIIVIKRIIKKIRQKNLRVKSPAVLK